LSGVTFASASGESQGSLRVVMIWLQKLLDRLQEFGRGDSRMAEGTPVDILAFADD
jgi:hypothetical protein